MRRRNGVVSVLPALFILMTRGDSGSTIRTGNYVASTPLPSIHASPMHPAFTMDTSGSLLMPPSTDQSSSQQGVTVGFGPVSVVMAASGASDATSGTQVSSLDDASSSSTLTASVTAQALQGGLSLTDCTYLLNTLNVSYANYTTQLGLLTNLLQLSSDKVSSVSAVTNSIILSKGTYDAQLTALNSLYNKLAVRSNALGSWMYSEGQIRQSLQDRYRELVRLSVEQSTTLATMQSTLTQVMSRLEQVQEQTSAVLSSVANAQVAMYPWGYNITVKVNNQTQTVWSLQSAMQYRIKQMNAQMNDLVGMSGLARDLSVYFGDANLNDTASSLLSRFTSVASSVSSFLNSTVLGSAATG